MADADLTLDEIANTEGTDKGSASGGCHCYVPLYERFLGRSRDFPVRLLEIGVARGASLRMWSRYFEHGQIFGIDDFQEFPPPTDWPTERIQVFQGSQADQKFLKKVVADTGGRFDVVIDDGSHKGPDILTSFQALFPAVIPGGLYFIEDLHTSYHPFFGGGYALPGTGIGMLKSLIDGIHWRFHGRQSRPGAAAMRELYGLKFPFARPPRPGPSEERIAAVHVFERLAVIEAKQEGQ